MLNLTCGIGEQRLLRAKPDPVDVLAPALSYGDAVVSAMTASVLLGTGTAEDSLDPIGVTLLATATPSATLYLITATVDFGDDVGERTVYELVWLTALDPLADRLNVVAGDAVPQP